MYAFSLQGPCKVIEWQVSGNVWVNLKYLDSNLPWLLCGLFKKKKKKNETYLHRTQHVTKCYKTFPNISSVYHAELSGCQLLQFTLSKVKPSCIHKNSRQGMMSLVTCPEKQTTRYRFTSMKFTWEYSWEHPWGTEGNGRGQRGWWTGIQSQQRSQLIPQEALE